MIVIDSFDTELLKCEGFVRPLLPGSWTELSALSLTGIPLTTSGMNGSSSGAIEPRPSSGGRARLFRVDAVFREAGLVAAARLTVVLVAAVLVAAFLVAEVLFPAVLVTAVTLVATDFEPCAGFVLFVGLRFEAF